MIAFKGGELVECLADKEIYIVGYGIVTEGIIREPTDVKLLLSVRDGPEENIDIDACAVVGTPVMSSAGRCVVSVVELAFLLMLILTRPMVSVIEKTGSGGWTKQSSSSLRNMYAHQSIELYNKNLGVIGFGYNAKSPSVLVNAFYMQVNAYDPYVSEEVTDSFHVKKTGLDQVVRTAGYVVVPTRLTLDTEGILSREPIFSTRPTASIVNMGWARLIDGETILDMLEQQVIKSAALSAHTSEPLGALSENRVYQISEDRLITTSHATGVTKEHSWYQYYLLYKQLLEYFQGNIPEGRVSKQVFDTPQFRKRGGKYFGVR